jgi:hypothetical protein
VPAYWVLFRVRAKSSIAPPPPLPPTWGAIKVMLGAILGAISPAGTGDVCVVLPRVAHDIQPAFPPRGQRKKYIRNYWIAGRH